MYGSTAVTSKGTLAAVINMIPPPRAIRIFVILVVGSQVVYQKSPFHGKYRGPKNLHLSFGSLPIERPVLTKRQTPKHAISYQVRYSTVTKDRVLKFKHITILFSINALATVTH